VRNASNASLPIVRGCGGPLVFDSVPVGYLAFFSQIKRVDHLQDLALNTVRPRATARIGG
jgi:hypothetical protein